MGRKRVGFLDFMLEHLVNDFIPKWEDWIDINAGSLAERELHHSLVRLFKGQVKALRRFRLKETE